MYSLGEVVAFAVGHVLRVDPGLMRFNAVTFAKFILQRIHQAFEFLLGHLAHVATDGVHRDGEVFARVALDVHDASRFKGVLFAHGSFSLLDFLITGGIQDGEHLCRNSPPTTIELTFDVHGHVQLADLDDVPGHLATILGVVEADAVTDVVGPSLLGAKHLNHANSLVIHFHQFVNRQTGEIHFAHIDSFIHLVRPFYTL